MESAEIQSVLYRASELQAKLDSAIARASTATAAATAAAAAELVEEEEEDDDDDDDDDDDEGNFGEEERGGENDEIGREHPGNAAAGDSSSQSKAPKSDKQMLGAIRQALVDLHRSLHSLQDLQKQQKSEREILLVDLDGRRDALIRRLREYNGSEWEIIEEAHAFVGIPMQRKEDLVLPPYQVPITRILDFSHVSSQQQRSDFSHVSSQQQRPDFSHLSSQQQRSSSSRRRAATSARNPGENDAANRYDNDDDDDDDGGGGDGNGHCAADDDDYDADVDADANNASDGDDEMGKEDCRSANGAGTRPRNNLLGFQLSLPDVASRAAGALRLSAKTLLMLSGVITVFALSHFQARARADQGRKMNPSSANNPSRGLLPTITGCSQLDPEKGKCPPGKVLLVRDGIEKCFVKERIEAPFKEVFKHPDASYGYG